MHEVRPIGAQRHASAHERAGERAAQESVEAQILEQVDHGKVALEQLPVADDERYCEHRKRQRDEPVARAPGESHPERERRHYGKECAQGLRGGIQVGVIRKNCVRHNQRRRPAVALGGPPCPGHFILCAATYLAKCRRERKISPFSSLSARSWMPYCLETTSATSRMSMESRPSPSPYNGASGLISRGSMSRLSACTMRAAISRSSAAGSGAEVCWRSDAFSGIGSKL